MRLAFYISILFLCPTLMTSSANAELGLDFTTGSSQVFGGGGGANVGWEFTLSESIDIDGLGFWDHDANGLFNSHAVGVWNINDTSTLIATTTVTNSSGQNVASNSTLGQWVFNDVPTFTLGPGTYVVAANVRTQGDSANQDFWIQQATANLADGVTFVQARSDGGSTLAFPSQPRSSFGVGGFGANFRISAVPEPTSFLMFGTALLAGVRRRRIA